MIAVGGNLMVRAAKELAMAYKRATSSSIVIDERQVNGIAYSALIKWLMSLPCMQKNKHVYMVNAYNKVSGNKAHINGASTTVPAAGVYKQTYKGLDLIITLASSEDKNSSVNGCITITATNDRRGRLLNIVEAAMEKYLPTNVISVNSNNTGSFTLPTRNMDTVIIDEEQKSMLISHLNFWRDSKHIYDDIGMMYKTGILLEGPPGTGKSSLVRAIASYMDMPIIVTSILKIGLHQLSGNAIYLIEDVDRDMNDMDSVVSINDKLKNISYGDQPAISVGTGVKASGAYISEFMNILDGTTSPSNSIFILSTNHIEDIDEAVIRPGRIDIRINMKYFTKDLAEKLCKQHNVDSSVLDTMKEEDWRVPSKLTYELLRIKKEIHEKNSR